MRFHPTTLKTRAHNKGRTLTRRIGALTHLEFWLKHDEWVQDAVVAKLHRVIDELAAMQKQRVAKKRDEA